MKETELIKSKIEKSIILLTVIIRVVMQMVMPVCTTTHYDFMQINGALNIFNGKWLGNGNEVLYRPAFSMILAFFRFLNMPYLLGISAIYTVACLVIYMAFRKRITRVIAYILFLIILFNPFMFTKNALSLNGFALIAALVLFVVGAYLNIYFNRKKGIKRNFIWIVIASFAFMIYSLIVDENRFLMFFITGTSVVILFLYYLETKKITIKKSVAYIIFLTFPLIFEFIGVTVIKEINHKFYKTYEISTYKECYKEIHNDSQDDSADIYSGENVSGIKDKILYVKKDFIKLLGVDEKTPEYFEGISIDEKDDYENITSSVIDIDSPKIILKGYIYSLNPMDKIEMYLYDENGEGVIIPVNKDTAELGEKLKLNQALNCGFDLEMKENETLNSEKNLRVKILLNSEEFCDTELDGFTEKLSDATIRVFVEKNEVQKYTGNREKEYNIYRKIYDICIFGVYRIFAVYIFIMSIILWIIDLFMNIYRKSKDKKTHLSLNLIEIFILISAFLSLYYNYVNGFGLEVSNLSLCAVYTFVLVLVFETLTFMGTVEMISEIALSSDDEEEDDGISLASDIEEFEMVNNIYDKAEKENKDNKDNRNNKGNGDDKEALHDEKVRKTKKKDDDIIIIDMDNLDDMDSDDKSKK